jgi:hypothetical protein
VGVVTKLAQAYYPTSNDGFDGSDWRIRDPDEVVREITGLNSEFGINKVFFIDSGFNIPVDHAKTLCRAIIDSGIKIRWNSYVRPGYGDDELVRLMKESGCSLALLAESGRGGGELGDRLDGLGVMGHLCQEAGLPFALNISFGEPGENQDTVDQKLSLLRQVEPAFAVLRLGSRVLPNTPVASTAIEEGMIGSESDLIRPFFYVSEEVRDWLPDRLKSETANRPRWNLT